MPAATAPAHLPLRPHPTEQGPQGLSVSVSVPALPPAGDWCLCYEIRGDVGDLRLPEPATPGPADGLWRHTCLEAFVREGEGPTYREFNFSPSGQWAVYRFRAERERAPQDPPPSLGPAIGLEPGPDVLRILVRVPHALLPERPGAIGLTAVIETRDGRTSHWALHHPRPERPDFHHAAGWTHPPALTA